MQFKTKAILAAVILASATNAFAASTADLRVIGTVIPGACTPVFAGGATVDYGKISASDLSATVLSALSKRQISYTITCDAPIVIGTSWVDNRTSSSSIVNDEAFGIGLQGATKIGYYTLTNLPAQMLADGAAIDTIVTETNGATWLAGSARSQKIAHGATDRMYSFAAPGTLIPSAHMTYAGVLSVQARVVQTSLLDMTAPITLDGLSTMEVRYL